MGERGRVLVSLELYEELGEKARAVLAKTAPIVPYDALSAESEAALRALGEKQLLQLIRDAQAARGDRVMGSFAMITTYPLVMDHEQQVRRRDRRAEIGVRSPTPEAGVA